MRKKATIGDRRADGPSVEEVTRLASVATQTPSRPEQAPTSTVRGGRLGWFSMGSLAALALGLSLQLGTGDWTLPEQISGWFEDGPQDHHHVVFVPPEAKPRRQATEPQEPDRADASTVEPFAIARRHGSRNRSKPEAPDETRAPPVRGRAQRLTERGETVLGEMSGRLTDRCQSPFLIQPVVDLHEALHKDGSKLENALNNAGQALAQADQNCP